MFQQPELKSSSELRADSGVTEKGLHVKEFQNKFIRIYILCILYLVSADGHVVVQLLNWDFMSCIKRTIGPPCTGILLCRKLTKIVHFTCKTILTLQIKSILCSLLQNQSLH